MAFFSKAGNILRQTISKTQISHEISASTPAAFQFLRFMSSKVFVGGLPWSIDDSSLVDTFSKYGEVVEARVITDRDTGRSRGFGFVTYRTAEDASSAIQALDGKMLENRQIKVNLANDRPRTSGGGGYGGGGGGYGGGGYGGGGYSGGGGYGSGGGGGYGGNSGYGGSNDGNFGNESSGGNYSGSVGYGNDNFTGGGASSDSQGFSSGQFGEDDQNDDFAKRA